MKKGNERIKMLSVDYWINGCEKIDWRYVNEHLIFGGKPKEGKKRNSTKKKELNEKM